MAFSFRRRSLVRVLLLVSFALFVRLFIFSPSSPAASVTSKFYYASDPQEIQKQGVLDLVTGKEKALDARKHTFVQVRLGRDEREDLFSDVIRDGVLDYWDRFQKP